MKLIFENIRNTCCICGKEFDGYGNNPYPYTDEDGVCCDECNMTYVIPARIRQFRNRSEEED